MSDVVPAADLRPEIDVDACVRQLQNEGYAVLPSLYSASEIELLRTELTQLWEENGRLPLYQDDCGYVAENVEIWGLGLVFHKLLRFKPQLAKHLVKPETARVLHGLFPEGVYVEKTGAVLSDSTRPFFQWHTHVGGIDDELYRKQGWTPQFDRAQRVNVIIYLNGIEPNTGQVLIWPRRESDRNAEPPFSTELLRWEGQVEVTAPPGSVLILEQCTWHAALVRRVPGVRMFVGAYYASTNAPPTFDVDESLLALGPESGALQQFQLSAERSTAPKDLPPGFAGGPQTPTPGPGNGGARALNPLEGLILRLREVGREHRATLSEELHGRGRTALRFVTIDGGGVDLVLEPVDERRPALRRSASFNVRYGNVVGQPTERLRQLTADLIEAIVAEDSGGLEPGA